MHPAIPLATRFLSEHTGTMVQLLEKRGDLNHGLRLTGMLQEVISEATSSTTERQIEAILSLTRQTHEVLAANLNHYMGERQNFSAQYRTTTDALFRAEITTHITNIDDQMKSIRRDMEALHRFSASIITICGEAGLRFVENLALPYTMPNRRG